MLKLRVRDNKHQAVWLVEPGVKVGRRASNDLILDEPGIADLQFVIGVKGEQLIFHNRAPDTTINLNGKAAAERCLLKERDIISLGRVELEVIDPKKDLEGVSNPAAAWSLKSNSPGIGNRLFPLPETSLVGRSNECDIRLAVAHLSRRHAQLQVINGLLYVKDLGSANGTFLNGQRVNEARVRRGDELRFDTLSFGVLGPSDELDKTTIRTPKSPVRSAARPANASGAHTTSALATSALTTSASTNSTGRPVSGPQNAFPQGSTQSPVPNGMKASAGPAVEPAETGPRSVWTHRWAVWLIPSALLILLLLLLLKP